MGEMRRGVAHPDRARHADVCQHFRLARDRIGVKPVYFAELGGQPRIIHSNASLRRVVDMVPSRANAICYCVGSLHPAGEDLAAGIRGLGDAIAFVHARNVRGTATRFVETWHDDGEIDMPAVFRALKGIGYSGTVRPDHAPSMAGEPNDTPGYEMLGRLFAAGYLRGLIEAA
jgi:mannonate dehydratase